jgi:hypothetical protein
MIFTSMGRRDLTIAAAEVTEKVTQINLHVRYAGRTCLSVSQPGFVSLLIRFHFFFLMLPLGLLRKPWLNFVAVQKRSPCRVRTVLTIL